MYKRQIRWRDEGLFAVAVWKKEVLEEFILPENPEVHHVVAVSYTHLIRVISSFCWADVPDVTAAAALPVPPRYIRRRPSRPAVPRSRREMRLPSERFRDCSAVRKSAASLRKMCIRDSDCR